MHTHAHGTMLLKEHGVTPMWISGCQKILQMKYEMDLGHESSLINQLSMLCHIV